MAKQVINYSTRDFNSVIAQIDSDSELKEQPARFKNTVAGIFDALSNLANAMANSAFINTSFSRPHVQELLALIDYFIPWKQVASVQQEFTINASATASGSYTILAADLVAGTIGTTSEPAERFEAIDDLTFTIGTTVSSQTLYHQTGQPQQNIGTTDGSDYQEVDLPDLDIVASTLRITIGSDIYFVVPTFADSTVIDFHCRIFFRTDGSSFVKLPGVAPDGTAFGKKPAPGLDIYADYSIGGGLAGNKAAGTITEYLGADPEVVATTNNNASKRGLEEQSISLAKEQSRLELRSVGFFTNSSTALALARTIDGVLNVSVVKKGVLEVDVFIMPVGGGLPDADMRTQVRELLERKSYLEEVTVNDQDPIYISTGISGNVRVLQGFIFSDIIKYIELAASYRVSEIGFEIHEIFLDDDLSATIDKINATLVAGGLVSSTFNIDDDGPQITRILTNVPFQNFGEDLQPEDIISAVQGFVFGVDFVNIINPSSTLSVSSGAITQPVSNTWVSI